ICKRIGKIVNYKSLFCKNFMTKISILTELQKLFLVQALLAGVILVDVDDRARYGCADYQRGVAH
ncbi:MAG: hypothetical protein LBS61_03250, partial [Endomicrobium sp.]|nr:hypothetical protein [Endomicrobium sp.]